MPEDQTDSNARPFDIEIAVTPDGTITWNGEVVTIEEMHARMRDSAKLLQSEGSDV